ncbi:gag-polypeptide of LTR copia-type [Artemisia annua]|uniref:Gag-polypeptide of LTR copia-type n=1 Tax=Artemisia annua TaxID=35608 RepID=A0A2U1M4B7_ARTAN|nr:gag-polypeptide of LTR copia-type [Artemisia annua]
MAASSASSETLFSMTAFNHMMHMKLSSSNYLVWREQMLLVLDFHTLSAHVAADATPPPALITVAGKSSPNPDAAAWFDKDQKAVLLIKSSLTEEAAAEVLGLKGARDIWTALEQAYSNASVERIHSLRDSLRLIKKGTSSSLHGTETPTVAFNAQQLRGSSRGSHSGRGSYSSGRGSSRGRGRGQQQRRPPHCQLCRTNGHYASACPELHSFASKAPSDESLVKAFHAQCHVTDDSPDWRADSGSSQHIDLSSLVVTSFLDEPSFVSTVEHHRSPSTTSMPSSDTNMLPPFNFFEAESNAPAQQHVSETTSPVHEPTMSTDPTPVSGPETSSPNTATSSGPASASVLDHSTSAHPMQTRSKAGKIS